MTAPSTSVVVPSYRHAGYVVAAVESALADGADEVVVVDDGSDDGSPELLRPLATDPRVTLLEQENRGAHAAIARGVAASRGEVVFVLNSDDLFVRGRVPRLAARFAARPDLAVAVSWLEVIDAEGRSLGVKEGWRNLPPWPRPGRGPGLADTGDPQLALLEANYVATTSNVAFRRELVDAAGVSFLPLRYCHDWDFLLAAGEHGELEVVPEPLVRYRVHGTNTIGEGRDAGRGRMRFEATWVVARWARRVLERRRRRLADDRDLAARFWASAPRFGGDELLAELLALRGDDPTPPAAYDALLDPGHLFHRRWAAALAAEEP